MSRNYNIRRKEAIRRLRNGDLSGVFEASEKADVIKTYRKYKAIYPLVAGNAKERKLRNSVVVRAARKATLSVSEDKLLGLVKEIVPNDGQFQG